MRIHATPNRAYEKPETFHNAVQKGVDNRLFSSPTSFPRTIPFRACPGSIEPKKKKDTWRLIWNHSAPHLGTWASTIEGANGTAQAIATRGITEILLEWASIGSNNEFVVILTEGVKITGHNVLGYVRVFDLKNGSDN